MQLPDESKFKRWRWVEIARYVPDLGRVIREQTGPKNARMPVIMDWEEDIPKWRTKRNNHGLYTTVYHYDNKDLTKATRLASLYFDLDNKENPEQSRIDALKLVNYLTEYVDQRDLKVYFTGHKGFHVEVEAIPLGIGPSNKLPEVFRFIASNLRDKLEITTFDFQVYDLRRMWRLPNSQHQETALYKVPLELSELELSIDQIRGLAEYPRDIVPVSMAFNAKANEWYRDWTYQMEVKSQSVDDVIDRFNKHGTGVFVDLGNTSLEFTPDRLFENCPVILRHWEQAEQEHDLPHEVRLFLCSILTYTEEAQEYLHAILRNCDDYNPDKSEAHIRDWIKRREMGIGGRPFTCEKANAIGVGCGSCELEPRRKLVKVGGKLVESNEYSSPSPIRYAYERKKQHGNS